MYAAAGGASLASRKARQTKQKKTQLAQEKLAKAKSGLATPPRLQQSRQFHQLPPHYYLKPHGLQSRKLSAASFAAQSRLLLPIHEGNGHHHSHSHHSHSHHGAHHHLTTGHHHHHLSIQHHQGRPSTPRLLHPDDDSDRALIHHHTHHLTKSATATLPLVSQVEATPPGTPDSTNKLVTIKTRFEIGDDDDDDESGEDEERVPLTKQTLQALPFPHDSIIVTPATPIASPGHSTKGGATSTSSQALAAAEEKDFFGPGPLQRKCSFQRERKLSDTFDYQYESDSHGVTIISPENYMPVTGPDHPFYPPGLELTQAQLCHYRDYTDDGSSKLAQQTKILNGGSSTSVKWAQCAYCEEGICTCDHIECAQGRAAWLERERIRRCSIQDKENAASCHRRWVKRNRIQDASVGGSSSDDEDILGVLRGPSNFANAFLYVGLGTVAIGLVIAFVGTGEKGFKTVELRLIGPALIGIGLICCILRICFCICPSHCISKSRRARKKNSNKVDADHTTSLLRGETKRVQIAKGSSTHKFPLSRKKSNNKMLNDGMEALRQIATTSLFLQNEQLPPTTSTSSNRIVPIIKEPEKTTESALEMKKLDTTLNISDITDDEDEDDDILISTKASSLLTNKKAPAATNTITNNSRIINDNSIIHENNNKLIEDISSIKIIKNNEIDIEDDESKLIRTQSKLGRKRVAINQQQLLQQSLSVAQIDKNTELDSDTLLMETSLMEINPSPISSGKLEYKSVDQSLPSSSGSIPVPITLLSPRTQFDLPSSKPHYHQQHEQTKFFVESQQHTPGQILDPKLETKIANDLTLGSHLILTPSLLPTTSNINYLGQQNTTASSSSSSLTTVVGSSNSGLLKVTIEPSELVLSPSKLGQ